MACDVARAEVISSAPMRWADCTEKAGETANVSPFISHVLDATSPMMAEAYTPSTSTMAELMYCMTIVVICIRRAGRLSRSDLAHSGKNFLTSDGFHLFSPIISFAHR